MEREHRPMITLFHAGEICAGEIALDDDAAHHIRVRRASVGDRVRLLDGRGAVGEGSLSSLGKTAATISLDRVSNLPMPTPLTALVPVADRDRMLLAAEKCAELQVTTWQPVYFARSRSVTPRGEGERFREKLVARMRSALEQSGGAWLPEVKQEVESADAWDTVARGATRLLLDASGEAFAKRVTSGPMAIAVGPEGGFERSEIDAAEQRGWTRASLGSTTLRFETAVVAGAAVIRATQLTSEVS